MRKKDIYQKVGTKGIRIIKKQFREYQPKVEIKNNQLSYICIFQLNKGRYPASDFAGFFDKVKNAKEMCFDKKIV